MNVQNQIFAAVKSSSIEIYVRDSQAVAVNFVPSQCFHFAYLGSRGRKLLRDHVRGFLTPFRSRILSQCPPLINPYHIPLHLDL